MSVAWWNACCYHSCVLAVGDLLAQKYRILRALGSGGMGTVYEARHEGLGALVAIKVLHPELAARPAVVERLMREAQAAATIDDPHVVRVLDAERGEGGLAYIVYERLTGITLAHLLEDLTAAGAELTRADAIAYAVQITEGVAAAHRAGIVHRDLKPENVMVCEDARGAARLVVLDFGIAKVPSATKLTAPGTLLGTPAYMAPEQLFDPQKADARSDVFAVGVILYELLAKRLPFESDDPFAIASAYATGQVPKLHSLVPGLDPALAAIVDRALAPKREDRFPSAIELHDALVPFASHRASKPHIEVDPASERTLGVGIPALVPPTNPGVAESTPRRPSGTEMVAPLVGAEDGDRISATVLDNLAPLPPPPAARPRRRGPPLVLILGIASAVSVLVTGGIYIGSRVDDRDDLEPTPVVAPPPPPTLATSEPPVTATPPPVTTTAQKPPPRPTTPPTSPPLPTLPPFPTSPFPPVTSPPPPATRPPPPPSAHPPITIFRPKPSATAPQKPPPPPIFRHK